MSRNFSKIYRIQCLANNQIPSRRFEPVEIFGGRGGSCAVFIRLLNYEELSMFYVHFFTLSFILNILKLHRITVEGQGMLCVLYRVDVQVPSSRSGSQTSISDEICESNVFRFYFLLIVFFVDNSLINAYSKSVQYQFEYLNPVQFKLPIYNVQSAFINFNFK